ncbi:MAG: hypothetical protein M1542_08285 [Thermotogae bacterium]|jgi:hypothetical protein|nr:hypothetical protein [Thermotogota bacterium]MCL5033225.1 hypothetical protein [Thermotogota bacterium]
MNILTSVRSFLEKDFGDFFCDLEDFYLDDLLVLVQCIISKRYSSISFMSKDALIDLSHTTLTRFINERAQFWSKLDKEIIVRTLEQFKSDPDMPMSS